MKVFLIFPYLKDLSGDKIRQDIMPSEALLSLAAVLREAGHTPIIGDFKTTTVEAMPNPQKYSYEKIYEIIKKEQPPLVGISFLFGGDFPDAWDLAKFIKPSFPEVKIITGGIHATTFPVEILSNANEFDYIAIGEGENQIVELANRIETSNLSNLEDIKGFAFRDNDGSVKVNTTRNVIDYDSLPMPAWDLIDFKDYEIDISNYFNPKGHELKNIVNIFSERGCPFNCRFCDLHLMQGRKVRRRSPKKFVDGLSYLVNKRGQKYFRFQDDNLLVDNKHVINLCKEIVNRGLDIQFDIAGGHVNSYTDEVIDHLVQAGLVSMILNIEHGSEYMRRHIIGKPITNEKIFAVMDGLRRYEINVGSNWVMGFPEDTHETLQETYDLICELKPDRANVGTLIPYPGTPIYDQCIRDDLFIEKFDLKDYWKKPFRPHQNKPVIKPYDMSIEDLISWREKFLDITYKYYGHCHSSFKPPVGYFRDDDGLIKRLSQKKS